jgi:hypothetical protein
VIKGAANGGFFSTMPTVVSNVFGSARLSVAMGMIVTRWPAGISWYVGYSVSSARHSITHAQGAPIAGYLLNAYGGAESMLSAYHPAMFYSGSMGMGTVGLVSIRTST